MPPKNNLIENLQSIEDFEWMDEPNVQSVDNALEDIKNWRNIAATLNPNSERERKKRDIFISESNHVLENPEIYDQDFYHGTPMTPVRYIMEEMFLRGTSSISDSKSGQFRSQNTVSSSSNIFDALFFSKKETPVLDQVRRSIESNILEGDEKLPPNSEIADLKDYIEDALEEQQWFIRGVPLEESDILSNSHHDKSYREKQLNGAYRSILDRLDEIGGERDPPAIFGYGVNHLVEPVKEIYAPLYENELDYQGIQSLAEIQSKGVDLGTGRSSSIYVPHTMREEFVETEREFEKWDHDDEEMKQVRFRYGDRIQTGSIQGLKILHLARNKENYRINQELRNPTPVWGGITMFREEGGRVDYPYDSSDLSANPYQMKIIGD
jgi:hypothetical protein